MKYLGILLVVALVFVGSVAMANVWCELKGKGWSGQWGNIYFNVKVEPYIEVKMPKDVFLWHIDSPVAGIYTSSTPATIEVRVNYPGPYSSDPSFYRMGYTGFYDPRLKEDATLDSDGYVQGGTINNAFTIDGWWQFQVDQDQPSDNAWIPTGDPSVIAWFDIPCDGDRHTVYVWTRIKVPENPVPKAGLYTDTDIEAIITPAG